LEDFSFFLNNKIGGDFITFKYRYRKQIFIATIITIFIVTISIIIFLTLNNKNDSKEEPLLVEKKEPKKEKSKTSKELVKVDIKGAINNPGIYSLNTDSRVVDVIEMAGGLTEEADTSVINLSKKLSDEMVIIIYTKTEVKDFENIKAPIFTGYDYYLKNLYGDYMKIPPKEKRERHCISQIDFNE